jgi:hypothetical protein
MAIRLTCQCGTVLQVQDDAAGKMVGCPRCQAVMSAPRAASYPPPNLPGELLAEAEEPEEVWPLDPAEVPKAGRKRKSKAKARRRGLERVSTALGFHYASPFVVLAAVLTGCLGLAFMTAAQHPALEEMQQPVRFFVVASDILLLLAGLLEIPVLIFYFAVPDGVARGLALGSFGLRLCTVVLAVLSLILPDAGLALTAVALVMLLGSWVLWMVSLQRLALYLNRNEMAEHALQLLRSGLLTLLGSLATIFGAALVIMLIATMKFAFVRYLVGFVALSIFGGLVKIAAILREGDSFFGFFLAPTGVPYVLRYFDQIDSLRTVIARRS